MKIKRVISCLLVAVFSMSLLLVQESAQAKLERYKRYYPRSFMLKADTYIMLKAKRLGLPERIFRICSGPQAEIMTL